MNLLPNKEELIPINDSNSTFYDCGFNKKFDELSFIQKLKVVNDLVRQSILPEICSDVNSEQESLIGNCHTAAFVSIEYLKELGIGFHHRFVLARRKKFEPEDITTKHALVLVDDEFGNTYTFDATPFVGYGYGTVCLLKDNSFYEEYIELDDNQKDILKVLRKFLFDQQNRLLTEDKIKFYMSFLEVASQSEVFHGFTSYCYKLLADYPYFNLDKECLVRKSIIYNPYNILNPDASYLNRKNLLALKQIDEWKQELRQLILESQQFQTRQLENNSFNKKNNLQNLKRQLELSQWIAQETKLFNSNYERKMKYHDKEIPFSHLTPRFFYENELNAIVIKASAYRLGVRGTIRERMLDKKEKAIGEYFTNFSLPTDITGIKPILFSHPLGSEYERSMNGIADTFLIRKPVDVLYQKKKILRRELGKNIHNKEVLWFDGEKILWHPFVTNLVHSTDNPSEVALHYLMAYPEHQVMTRFMYPNLKLEKVKK